MSSKKPARKRPSSEGLGLRDQLRDAIRSSGLSLNQLGECCGVDRGRLSRFMRGERGLSLESVEVICKALGLCLTASKPGRRKGPTSLFDR